MTRPAPLTDEQIRDALGTDRWIYLAIGPHVWGKGFTRDQAIRAAKDEYTGPGRMPYVVQACADPWARITEMGDIEYTPRTPTRASLRHQEYITVEDHS